MMLRHLFVILAASIALATPALAQIAAFGTPSDLAFQPYHPYRDSAIVFPTHRGPVPVHVRIYSTPMMPTYYNVPPYIVLDP